MLTVELHTQDIPGVYGRFAQLVGEEHWTKRLRAIEDEIRGNTLLRGLLHQENAIAYQLERLKELHGRSGGNFVQAHEEHAHYPAASLAAQVLSVVDASEPQVGKRLIRRVHGAFKNPAEMRAMRVELMAATHFLRAGRKVSWPEMTEAPATGAGTFDLLIDDIGPNGLEVECKSISDQKGRRITRRQALDFYGQVLKRHWARLKYLRTGVLAVITVPSDLPKDGKERKALADVVVQRLLHCALGEYREQGAHLRVAELDTRLVAQAAGATSRRRAREIFDEVTGTRNREAFAVGTPAGGAVMLVVQSEQDDDLMDSVFATLRDSAGRQFSQQRAAIFVVGFDGLDAAQLLDIARQDQDPGARPTALRVRASDFLDSASRDHLVGLTFFSASNLRTAQPGLVDSGGTAYHFPKPNSRFWAEAYRGMFGRDPPRQPLAG